MPKTDISPVDQLKTMLDKYQLNGSRLAKAIGSNPASINLVLNGKCKITMPVGLRLAKFFNTAPDYWLVLQMKQELSLAAQDKKLQKALSAIVKVSKPEKSKQKAPLAKKKKAAKAQKGA
jgi:addiction module HigA family antidote